MDGGGTVAKTLCHLDFCASPIPLLCSDKPTPPSQWLLRTILGNVGVIGKLSICTACADAKTLCSISDPCSSLDEVCHYFRWFPSPSFVYFFAPLLLLWQAGIPVQCFVINCNFEITYVAIKSFWGVFVVVDKWPSSIMAWLVTLILMTSFFWRVGGKVGSRVARYGARRTWHPRRSHGAQNGLFGGWEKEQWGLKMNYVRNWENHVLVPPQTDQSCNHTWI